jgi:UDP-glucuronate 4-epimerase
VAAEEWCAYVGGIIGATPEFTRTDAAIPSVPVDTSRMRELVGVPKVGWREGFGRLGENLMASRRPG